MPGENYNLGISVSVQRRNVDKQLKQIQNKFAKFGKQLNKINQNINKTSNKTIKQTGKEINQYDNLQQKISNLTTQNKKYRKQKGKLGNMINNQGKRYGHLKKQMDKHAKATTKNRKATDNWLSSYSESTAIAIKSTAIWGAATTAIYGSKRALEEIHQIMVDVNREMVALRRVMDASVTDFNVMQAEATELGKEYAASVDNVVQSMVQWGRQGKNQVEVLELTEAALLATNVAEMEAKESVDLLTSAILQYNRRASEAVEIVDMLNATANNYATTANDLAKSIREAGAASKNAGVSMDELIGITTALTASTAKSGNRIGRALRTVFSRMMGDAQNAGEALGKVETQLNQVGVAVRESETEYRSMTDVLTDLATKWNEIDEVMQANIARAIGGRRRYSDVISLIENWDMALDATETSMTSLNSSIEENEKYMASIEANWKQVQAQFQSLSLTISNVGGKALSKDFAAGAKKAIGAIEDIIVGVERAEEKFNAFKATLIALGGFITVKLIGQISSLYAVLAAHPVITAGALGVAAITTYLKRTGAAAKQTKKFKNEREELNKVIEKGNELSLEELKNIDSLIEKNRDLISEYQNAQEELEGTQNNVEKVWSYTRDHIFRPIAADTIFGLISNAANETIVNTQKAEKALGQLEDAFPNIAEKFNLDTDSGVNKFLGSLIEKFQKIQKEVESSVSWIDKYSEEQYNSVKQGMRENQMLQNKVERYNELSNATNLTVKEEGELFELTQDLSEEFPRVNQSSNSFGETLQDIAENKMKKFGKEGTKIQATIEDFEKKIVSLSESEEYLSERKTELADKISNLEKEYKKLDPKENFDKWQEIGSALDKANNNYQNVIEQLRTTRKVSERLKKQIAELESQQGDFKADKFYASINKSINILTEFSDKVTEIKNKLSDLDTTLSNRLDFAKIKAQLKGLSDVKTFELIREQYSKTQEELLGYIQTLTKLEDKPYTEQTAEEIRNALKEAKEIEGIDVSVDRIIEEWKQGAGEGFKETINDLKTIAKDEFKQLNKEIKDTDTRIDIAKVLGLKDKNISQLSDDILNQYENALDNISQEDLNKIGKDKKLSLLNIGDNIQEENEFRSLEEDLNQVYDNLSSIVDVPTDQQPLLNGTAEENVKELRKSVADIVDRVTSIGTQEGSSLDDKISALTDNKEKLNETITTLSNIQRLTDEGIISDKALNNLDTYIKQVDSEHDSTKDLIESLKEKQRQIEISNKIEEERLALLDGREAKIQKIKSRIDELRKLKSDNDTNFEDKIAIGKIINNLEQDIEDLNFQPVADKWENIAKEINKSIEKDIFELKILPEDEKQKKIKRIQILQDAIMNLSSQSLDFTNKSNFESYIQGIEETITKVEYLDKKHEDVDLAEKLNLKLLKQQLKDANSEFNDFEEIRTEAQIKDLINEKQLNNMSELERKLQTTKNQLDKFEDIRKDAQKLGMDKEEIQELSKIIKNLNLDINELQKKQKVMDALGDTKFSELLEDLKDIDSDEISSITEGFRDLSEVENIQSSIENIINNLNNVDQDALQNVLKKEGYSEEEIDEIINNIKGKISNLRIAWVNTITEGLKGAFERIDNDWSVFRKFSTVIEETMNSALNNLDKEKITKGLQGIASGISSALDFSDELSEGIKANIKHTVDNVEQGDSVGTMIATSIGAAVGGAAGATIGRGIGKLTETFIGEDTGVGDKKKADEYNKQIADLTKRLDKFNTSINSTKAKVRDTANAFESFFGKSEYKVIDLEKAEKSIEEMEEVLGRLEDFASKAMSGVQDALANGMDYQDSKQIFEQNIGQALQDAIIDKIIQTAKYEKEIKELAGMTENIINEEGNINEKAGQEFISEMKNLKKKIGMDKKEYEKMMDWLEKQGMDFEDEEGAEFDSDQTFQAGSTTNITYHQQYVVKSQIFNGSKKEARRAAEVLAPYIEEYLDRESGR